MTRRRAVRGQLLPSRLRARSAVLSAARALALGASMLVAPIGAQTKDRPTIPADADTLFWQTYFALGVQQLTADPRGGESSFARASDLDPSRAEPLFGRWAAILMQQSARTVRGYFRGHEATLRRPAIKTADSLRELATLRNPFVHRALERFVVRKVNPQFVTDVETRGWWYYVNGQFHDAGAFYDALLERESSKTTDRLFGRALALVSLGRYQEALGNLQEVLTRERADAARETARMARRDEATRYLSQHVLLNMIGRVQLQLGDYDAARQTFGDAIVDDAGFAYAHVGLAASFLDSEAADRAADELAIAVELAPMDTYFRLLLGKVLVNLQRPDEASTHLLRASELVPRYAEPYFQLARAQEAQGRAADALALYTRFAALAHALDPTAIAVRARLDSLRASPPVPVSDGTGAPARSPAAADTSSPARTHTRTRAASPR